MLFALLSLPLSAHLHGIVYDDQGEPLAGANVWWAETTVGTTTDADGIFEIEPIRQTKLLVTSFLGYRNDTTRVKDRSTLMIVLIPADKQLDEVTVEARRQSVIKSRFSAFDTESFGQAELCRAACCNLSESFETSASVDVSYADAATGAKQIKMLGLSGTYVQLLTENTPAVRGLAQSFGMEYIPGSWMDAVQISKGTSSVINGYEAITGQINVEYLKPQTQAPVAVNLMLNTDLHAEANLTGGWDIPIPNDPMLGTLSTGVLAHYHEGAWPMDGNKDGMLDMPMDRILNILNRWYYKNDEYTFQFLVRGLHDERHGGQRETVMGKKMGITPPANPYLIDLRSDRIEGFMKNGIVFDEESGMSLGIIAAGSYHDQMNTYGNTAWKASQANGYLNAIFQNTWDRDGFHYDLHGDSVVYDLSHKLSVGASVNYDQYWENLAGKPMWPKATTGTSVIFDRRELTPGIFAEYTFNYNESLSLIAGLRGDWSSRYGFFVTPRMNIRYAPFEWWTLRGSIGLGYRSPNIIADNAAYLVSSREWVIGDKNSASQLLPFNPQLIHQERSINTGLTTVFDIPVGQRNLQLSAEYYFTNFFDALVIDLDDNTGDIRFYNLSDLPGGRSFSHTAQIEASMEVLRGWTITAAFRYNDVRQTSFRHYGSGMPGQYELREKALQNKFKGLITMSYVTPLKKWQFDVTAQFNGPGRVPDGVVADYYQLPGGNMNYPRLTADKSCQYYERNGNIYHKWYPQLLAQVTKYWRTCSLYLGAENMTNFTQDHPIAGTYNANGQVIMDGSLPYDASMVWAPTAGWKIYVGFRWALDRKEN